MSDDWKFGGFDDPEENWLKLPKAIYDNLHRFSSGAELKVVLYVLRHTWGYGDEYKAMSVAEISKGRLRKDGTRIDAGTGLHTQAVCDGVNRAIEHGFLRVWRDDTDLARKVKYYMLAKSDPERVPPGVELVASPAADVPDASLDDASLVEITSQLSENHQSGSLVKITKPLSENHQAPLVKITNPLSENHQAYIDRYLDRSSDRNPDTHLIPVEGGEPPKAPPTPVAATETGDPFFGQTRASWYGFGGQRKRSMQNTDAAGKIGLDAPAFMALVTRLAAIHHLTVIIDAGDDNELRRMQELAVLLAGAPFQIDTTEKIDRLYAAWKKQYGKGDVAPYANSLKNYASSLAQQGRLKDGYTIDAGSARAVAAEGPRTQAVRAKQRAAAEQLPALPSGDVDF
jgi:hypothetical protein